MSPIITMKFSLLPFIFLILFSCNNLQNDSENSDTQYAIQLIMMRIEKDKKIKEGQINIFTENERKEFKNLNYFKPDTNYIVNATIDKFPTKETLTLSTSDGQKREYIKYGKALFSLKDKEHSLLLLKDINEKGNKLFLSFTDATSGLETYGAGRYLDIVASENVTLLDFNLLYNPYCAFNDSFSCPFPPKGNNLDIKILAGEKNYKEL